MSKHVNYIRWYKPNSDDYTEQYQSCRPSSDFHMICNICGVNLGKSRPNWGSEHMKQFPDHKSFRTSDVDISETVLPEEWRTK